MATRSTKSSDTTEPTPAAEAPKKTTTTKAAPASKATETAAAAKTAEGTSAKVTVAKATATKVPAAKKTTAAKTAAAKTAAAKTTAAKATAAKTAATKAAATKAATTAVKATATKATVAKAAATKAAAAKPVAAKTTAAKATAAKVASAATAAAAVKATAAAKAAASKTAATKSTATKTAASKTASAAKAATPSSTEAKPKATTRRTTKAAPKKVEEPVVEAEAVKDAAIEEPAAKPVEQTAAEPAKKPVKKAAAKSSTTAAKAKPAAKPEPVAEPEPAAEPELPQPRRSVVFIGSECYPFVKTGGLGDVMYALPKALVKLNCDVKVILPKYACIKDEYKEKMVYRGAFDMDLCSDGRRYYVGIMEYVSDDGVVYDFIDNEEFFSAGNPYINLIDDIPKYCYFGKAALAALNYMDWTPDVIHCHDWQAGLVPVYLRTFFGDTPLGRSKVITTIHNLRFQGKYDIQTIQYWSGLPNEVFNMGALQEDWVGANMLKGGLAYSDMITTVSGTYAWEIQTPEYGEGLDAHLRHHAGKLHGIVNGIDVDMWDPATDELLDTNYSIKTALAGKKANKLALQKELGLEENPDKMIIGLISRLTNQKGLDLVTAIVNDMMDGNTQLVVLGTGEPQYEEAFRWFENEYKGQVCSNIMYDEARSHKIYAGCDAFLVPSAFEPCGLTQLISMHYGSIPIVRETGGLKDTVEPYNMYEDTGNGFTFDRYEAGLLLDAVNRAKTLYFENRESWDRMVLRDMEKDVSWENSAQQYRNLYLELTW